MFIRDGMMRKSVSPHKKKLRARAEAENFGTVFALLLTEDNKPIFPQHKKKEPLPSGVGS